MSYRESRQLDKIVSTFKTAVASGDSDLNNKAQGDLTLLSVTSRPATKLYTAIREAEGWGHRSTDAVKKALENCGYN